MSMRLPDAKTWTQDWTPCMELFDRRSAPKRHDTWFVYALVDSRYPDEIRYVGITNNPRGRLACHISTSAKDVTRKARWMRSVLVSDGSVLMGIMRLGLTFDEAKSSEVSLIAALDNLTNLTGGGDGTVGYTHSEAAKAKMSEARRGVKLPEDVIAKIADANRGRKASAITRERISASKVGKKRPASVGLAVGNARRGKTLSEDHRRKLSEAQAVVAKRPNDSAIRAGIQRLAGPKSNNKSGFKGVLWDTKSNKWRAQINRFGAGHDIIGRFQTAEEAAMAYDKAAYAAWGGDCYLNFPDRIAA